MAKVTITVMFDGSEISLPKKKFNLDPHDDMRIFKTVVIKDMAANNVRVSPEDQLNFAFARVDDRGRIIHFLGDHVQARVLQSSNGKMQAEVVRFSFKSRMDYPPNLSNKDIINANKSGKKQKFIKALMNEDVHGVTKYLSKGLDPNFIYPKTGECPLFTWSYVNPCVQEAFLNMLLTYGVHLDFKISTGESVIHRVIRAENLPAIKLLYFKGASLEEWDSSGIPAFFYAIDPDVHVRCLEFILEQNPPIDILDCSGNNLLHYCCKKGLTNHLGIIIKYVLTSHSQDKFWNLVFGFNNSGNTPLHLSVIQGHKSCLELLIRSKDCLTIQNSSNDTPIELAIRAGDKSLIDFMNSMIAQFSSNSCSPRHSLRDPADSYSASDRVYTEKDKRKFLTLSSKSSRASLRYPVANRYPAIFTSASNYTPVCDNELTLYIDDIITVILVLSTGVAFGYKENLDKKTYGWFPSSCVGLTTPKAISEFQNTRATVENITSLLPTLNDTENCNLIPVIVNIPTTAEHTCLGMELGCKRTETTRKNKCDGEPLIISASPFYVRKITNGSPAHNGGLRGGDQVIYILSNEITSFSMKNVSLLLKSIFEYKFPSKMPKETIKQIGLIVLRHNDASLNHQDNRVPTDAFMTDLQSLRTISSSGYSRRHSTNYDTSSYFNEEARSRLSNSGGVTSDNTTNSYGRYIKPLPGVPASSNIAISGDDSSDDVPMPPREFLCDSLQTHVT